MKDSISSSTTMSVAPDDVEVNDEEWDDIRFLLHRRSIYVDQLVRLCCNSKAKVKPRQPKKPLFTCLIMAGLKYDNEEEVYKPFIKLKYPSECCELPEGIEMFCFPDAQYWSPSSTVVNEKETGLSRTYSLVLTDWNGERRFGYCRRIIPEGEQFPIPLAYCIISSNRSRIYPKILEELEHQHGNDDDTTYELFRLLHSQSFPATVNEPIFVSHSGGPLKQIRRPLDNRLEENHVHLLHYLGIQTLLKVFVMMLLEHKVVIVGKSLGQVSATIESLCALLNPFAWQHTLIPVLPSHLLSIIDAPTPYLIGIHDNGRIPEEALTSIGEGIVVHVDDEEIIYYEGNDVDIWPQGLLLALQDRLQMVDMFSDEESDDQSSPTQSIIMAEAFTKFFLALIGDCSKFLTVHNGVSTFQKKCFIVSSNEAQRRFLQEFASTAMFHTYIETKLGIQGAAVNIDEQVSKNCCSQSSDLFQQELSLEDPNEINELSFNMKLYQGGNHEEEEDINYVLPLSRTRKSKRRRKSNKANVAAIEMPPLTSLSSIASFHANEVPVELTGLPYTDKQILTVPTSQNVSYLMRRVCDRKRSPAFKLLIDGIIMPSPTANIGDMYQIFKKDDGHLHMSYSYD